MFFCMNLCEYPYICYVYVCHFKKKKLNKNRVTQLCNFKIKKKNFAQSDDAILKRDDLIYDPVSPKTVNISLT